MAVAGVRALSSWSYLNVVLMGECFCCSSSSSRSTAIVQMFSIALGDIVPSLRAQLPNTGTSRQAMVPEADDGEVNETMEWGIRDSN